MQAGVASSLPSLEALSSGVVRFEVPFPRGCTSLQWLRGQTADSLHKVYFSGRSSSAADTPGATPRALYH